LKGHVVDWHWLVEHRIQKVIEAGDFDNLAGRGMPLNLESNAHIDAAWRLAYHVLRNAGMAPDWIEMRREIREEISSAREDLTIAATRHRESQASWGRALGRFEARLRAINGKIDELNLRVPRPDFQLPGLRSVRERERVPASVRRKSKTG
jgi:DnaJ family protein C protein 28